MTHSCQNCGAVADDPGHLCNPTTESLSCPYCGVENVSSAHVCKSKLAAMQYSCESCGRVAAKDTDLCKPYEIQ